jgi:hypothetical protein
VPGTLQVICGYQTVDAGADDGDVPGSLHHRGKVSLTPGLAQGSSLNTYERDVGPLL